MKMFGIRVFGYFLEETVRKAERVVRTFFRSPLVGDTQKLRHAKIMRFF
jgi:hypothetical protein